MIDIGFVGPEFTWKRGNSEARLDRMLANEEWVTLFPNASMAHLPFFKSDHRPLLLRLNPEMAINKPNRPFRFIVAWVLHDKFDDFVRQAWNHNTSWVHNISQFSDVCSTWNKEVFKHTELRKKRLLRRLDELNWVVARFGMEPKYAQLQLVLWKDLEDVLIQESFIWAQKARAVWTVYSDRNTHFFHARANHRKKSQRLEGIKDDVGSWVYDTVQIKGMATTFFSHLLSEDITIRLVIHCPMSYPSMNDELLRWCGRDVLDRGIKEAIFSMGVLKALGPNGFNALFYHNQWSTVCAFVVNYVKFLFANPQAIREINGTLIVLIPKKDHLETLGDLRPISLCNVIYKSIMKIIVSRLKNILPQVISPNQCSFVPSRHSSDNIIVAQEVIHSMRNMKKKKGFMAIKIDLEKAYDRVNWQLLFACLQKLHIPSSLREVIAQCVSTPSMQLLWNGDKAEEFRPSRGVRQGDPLSPYLFVICMEKLAHLIQAAIHEGTWELIRLSRTGPQISHLFFADDIMLFSEASMD
ncbi:hypothetical protein QN277_004892 [Acacia crassicarpa]|uniref:Reverse transcriptase domain-containing protein n=1 Tax=Acacia crassicarpa TaxID=499986 RepID=A0AAE1IVD7_9FABA|nr:hypothetical protein QN277_004892 [Acacia crassicarpa]